MLKKVLIIGVINLVLSLVLNNVFNSVFPQLNRVYRVSGMFRPWSDPAMMLFFAHPFITALGLTYLWEHISTRLKGNTYARAYSFTKVYFIIATVPGMFITYTSMKVSVLMIMSWVISGVLATYVAGWLLASWDKK